MGSLVVFCPKGEDMTYKDFFYTKILVILNPRFECLSCIQLYIFLYTYMNDPSFHSTISGSEVCESTPWTHYVFCVGQNFVPWTWSGD